LLDDDLEELPLLLLELLEDDLEELPLLLLELLLPPLPGLWAAAGKAKNRHNMPLIAMADKYLY
jgi:hypothetical protein